MSHDGYPQVRLRRAADAFQELIGRFGQHMVAAGEGRYLQPSTYLSFHLVQMRAAGWTEVDFDRLAAVSGSSALFAYQRDDFMLKYANLYIGMDGRIADATGFGYEWVEFAGVEGAWALLTEGVGAGRSLKGWHWENLLLAGYQDAARVEDRKVYAMADGPDTFARWWTWKEFAEWVQLVEGWGCPQVGRHTGRVQSRTAQETARRVLADLVAWSTDPPGVLRAKHPQAAFGLAGIEAFATDVADPDVEMSDTAWCGCHAINPQWVARNSTAVYLERLVEGQVFAERANEHLRAAAGEYRGAYAAWQVFYEQLGHGAPEGACKMAERRRAGGDAAREWLQRERTATDELRLAVAQ